MHREKFSERQKHREELDIVCWRWFAAGLVSVWVAKGAAGLHGHEVSNKSEQVREVRKAEGQPLTKQTRSAGGATQCTPVVEISFGFVFFGRGCAPTGPQHRSNSSFEKMMFDFRSIRLLVVLVCFRSGSPHPPLES